MVNPLRPSKNEGVKRLRRSPDSGDVLPPAKKPKVDDPTKYQADQAPSGAGGPRPASSSKPPSPVETTMDPRRPSDPRRRQSEPSQDPRRRPLPDSNQSPRTHSPTEASKHQIPAKPTRPSIPYAPMPTAQFGNAAPSTTPVAMSPSNTGKTSYFDPGISDRQKELKHQIADTLFEMNSLSMARRLAQDEYDTCQRSLEVRITATWQAQADEALTKRDHYDAELKKQQDKLHQLIDDEQQLQGQLIDAFDRIWQQLPQPSNIKPIGAADLDLSEVSQMIDSKLDARMTGYKASLRIEMSSDIDKKLADERPKPDLKDELLQMVEQKVDARMTGYKDTLKAEMTPVVDQKLADERASHQAEMTSVMDKKLAGERETTSKQMQKQLASLDRVQDESWELRKAGLSEGAVKRWCKSLAEHDNRLKTLEEANTSRRSPSPDLQNRVQKHEDRIKTLEGKVDKDLRPGLSRLDAKSKSLADAIQKSQEAGSANDLRSDLEQLQSKTKALEEGHAKLEEASATDDLRSELEILKSKSQGFEEGIEKLTTSGNGSQSQLEQLNAKSEAWRDSIQKLEQAHSSSKSQTEALAEDFKKLKEEVTFNSGPQSDIETLKAQTESLAVDFRDLKKSTLDLDVRADVRTLKSQSRLHTEDIGRLQNVSQDLPARVRKLEANVEAVQEVASSDARRVHELEAKIEAVQKVASSDARRLHELETNFEAGQEDVTRLKEEADQFSGAIVWIRRNIDHREDDFYRMPLYDTICTLIKRNGRGEGRSDDGQTSPLATIRIDQRTFEERQKRLEARTDGLDDRVKKFEDKYEEGLKRQEAKNDGLDDRVKELEDKDEENDREGDLWDEQNKLENQIAALNEKSHLLPGQFQELSRKFDQLSERVEALPARTQESEQLDREVKQLRAQVENIGQELEQVRSQVDNIPRNAVSTAPPQLSQDAVLEMISNEIRKFEEHVKVLEAQAKEDGRHLKRKLVGLWTGLQQDVKNLQDLDIIKSGRRDINSLSRFVRLHDTQIPDLNVKISFMENAHNTLVPKIIERAQQQEVLIHGTQDEILWLQTFMTSMAKRFNPAHYVPPDWERRYTPMEQGPAPGAPRMLPAQPPSAVQGQYRPQL
ncbi:uncharacterized protein J3D65DRAFT_604974 [Phyllosticta citribraziliensis]|uniref:Uncharacterized protein n=1 Tax=Phyllosticta citribraziliensis TaxID=989973 RepID=A0ABR1LFE9_9PEZI